MVHRLEYTTSVACGLVTEVEIFKLNRNSSPQIAKFATLHWKGATSGQSFVRDIEKAGFTRTDIWLNGACAAISATLYVAQSDVVGTASLNKELS